MDEGVFPSKIWRMKEERAVSSSLPPLLAEALVRSTKCCGRRPSGPTAELHGNDLIAYTISSSARNVSEVFAAGANGKQEQGGCGGCFALRADKVSSFSSANVSSEQTILTAPLTSSSSSLEDTHLARFVVESLGMWCFDD